MQGKSRLKGLWHSSGVLHQQSRDNCTDVMYVHQYSSLMLISFMHWLEILHLEK